ncbi:hypothetical protein PRZ48_013137 [Zasmidium cellare]|uniref:Fungal N-terminal domain-containing protein n=1 Tax=Zasmidium cellare TaxID=395010 RepID=A0ABR0E3G6_ZASCE|nr:hypothetical protein PRZ48_013137 [Zasmidium cellare]
MSFGFSPSDFVTLITIVTKSYKGWRNACGEYTDITTSLKQLLSLVQQVQEEVKSENSVLVRTPGDRAALENILRASRRTAQDLGEIIKDYDALGHGKSREKNWADLERNWKRFRFGGKDLQGLRSKIQGHVSMISAHLTAAGVSTLSRVELDIKALPDQMQRSIDGLAAEIRAGRREGSVLTTYDDDEKDVWRQFRRELIGEEASVNTTLDRDIGSDQLSSSDDSMEEQAPLPKTASSKPDLSDHTTLKSTEANRNLGLPATCITDDEAESDRESIEYGHSDSASQLEQVRKTGNKNDYPFIDSPQDGINGQQAERPPMSSATKFRSHMSGEEDGNPPSSRGDRPRAETLDIDIHEPNDNVSTSLPRPRIKPPIDLDIEFRKANDKVLRSQKKHGLPFARFEFGRNWRSFHG